MCVWGGGRSFFCVVVLCAHFSFAIILLRKIELVALFLLSSCCRVADCVGHLFPTVPWVSLRRVLRSVIVAFPGHTCFLIHITICVHDLLTFIGVFVQFLRRFRL